jgi:heat shock protein HslJ
MYTKIGVVPYFLIVVLCLLMGCSVPTARENEVLAGTWKVQMLNQNPVFSEGQPTIVFTVEGGVTGNTGCSTYNALYDSTQQELTIRDYTQVQNECINEDVLSQETIFREALEQVATFTANGNQVTLLNRSGVEVMVLEKGG